MSKKKKDNTVYRKIIQLLYNIDNFCIHSTHIHREREREKKKESQQTQIRPQIAPKVKQEVMSNTPTLLGFATPPPHLHLTK